MSCLHTVGGVKPVSNFRTAVNILNQEYKFNNFTNETRDTIVIPHLQIYASVNRWVNQIKQIRMRTAYILDKYRV